MAGSLVASLLGSSAVAAAYASATSRQNTISGATRSLVSQPGGVRASCSEPENPEFRSP